MTGVVMRSSICNPVDEAFVDAPYWELPEEDLEEEKQSVVQGLCESAYGRVWGRWTGFLIVQSASMVGWLADHQYPMLYLTAPLLYCDYGTLCIFSIHEHRINLIA